MVAVRAGEGWCEHGKTSRKVMHCGCRLTSVSETIGHMHLNLLLSTLTSLMHSLLVLAALRSGHRSNDEDAILASLSCHHSVGLMRLRTSHGG